MGLSACGATRYKKAFIHLREGSGGLRRRDCLIRPGGTEPEGEERRGNCMKNDGRNGTLSRGEATLRAAPPPGVGGSGFSYSDRPVPQPGASICSSGWASRTGLRVAAGTRDSRASRCRIGGSAAGWRMGRWAGGRPGEPRVKAVWNCTKRREIGPVRPGETTLEGRHLLAGGVSVRFAKFGSCPARVGAAVYQRWRKRNCCIRCGRICACGISPREPKRPTGGGCGDSCGFTRSGIRPRWGRWRSGRS